MDKRIDGERSCDHARAMGDCPDCGLSAEGIILEHIKMLESNGMADEAARWKLLTQLARY